MKEVLLLQREICRRDLQIADLLGELSQRRLADIEDRIAGLQDQPEQQGSADE